MASTLSTVVKVLRWILVLPAAMAAMGAAIYLAHLAIRTWPEVTAVAQGALAVGGVLGTVAYYYLGSRIAPSHRRLVIAVLLAAGGALVVVGLKDIWVTSLEVFCIFLGTLGGLGLALRHAQADAIGRLRSAEALAQRYKGTAPFRDLEVDRATFFGRERETRSLLSLVLAERLVVLFAKSGMGKSSLLQAGLFEPLRRRGYLPMVVRLADPALGPLGSLFAGIEQAARAARVDRVGGDESGVWRFFKTAELWSESDELLRPVLILDQFEELFTLHWPEPRREFIRHLAELVRGPAEPRPGGGERPGNGAVLGGGPPDLKIVLVLREDFLADLEELAREIPEILRHRFRLGPLTLDAARAAVALPASLAAPAFDTQPFTYRAEALDEILAFIARRRQGEATVAGDEVEPVQLQLLCHYLEERVRARQAAGETDVEIGRADLGGERRLRRVLEGFYDRSLAAIASPRERRRVRRLCEKRLISGAGRRLTEDTGEIERRHKISEQRLRQLVDARLLRAEPRLGGTFYELSHDRLVEPIRAARKHRRRRGGWMAAVVVALALFGLWISVLPRVAGDLRLERLAGGVPDPRQQRHAFLAQTRAKLDQIEAGYSDWVHNPPLHGAMAYAIERVKLRYPEARQRARELGEEIRRSFVAQTGREPPSGPEDARLNRRILIPGGSFLMGSPAGEGAPDEHPRHRVHLSAFEIQEHEVTNAEYRRFNPDHRRRGPYLVALLAPPQLAARNPVAVYWYEAMAYAAWLGGRLPTEAEWEFAARAGCRHEYCDREGKATTLDQVAWTRRNSGRRSQPVARLEPNPWGLYDMHGNAWEWVADFYGDYPAGERRDPWGPDAGRVRVLRGGSFVSAAELARSRYRGEFHPRSVWLSGGFRVVFAVEPSD